MRAIVNTDLSVSELPDPVANFGEVVIDVAAAGLNRADVAQRAGHYPPPAGAPDIFGLEVSGTVSAVGEGVTEWQLGDQICALLAGGGYAEKVGVPATHVLPVPAGVDLIDAAGLPEVACTVLSNLLLTAGLKPGETVLIHGGSSGIGSHAIQFAKALGATVATTARTPEKLATASALGADILIDYTYDDFAEVMRAHGGADVVLDIIGAKYLERNVAALATGGRLVVIGLQGGTKAEVNLGSLLAKRASIHGTTLRARPDTGPGSKAEIVAAVREHTWPLIESGAVAPVIDAVYPLDQAAAALAHLTSGDAVGKVLLRVS